MPHTTSSNIEEFSKRTIDLLFSRFGEFVAYTVELPTTDSAVRFLRGFSFVSGAELRTPDHIQAAISANQQGKDAFVILGGQFTPDENEEILRKADAARVQCRSVCIAGEGSKVQRDFMAAYARLKPHTHSREAGKKWWRFWK